MVMTSFKNAYKFRSALHRPAETLASVIMSQPPAAYSDCLDIKIPEEPNLHCVSAKSLGGHKFKIRLITTYKHTNAQLNAHSSMHTYTVPNQ